MSITNYDWTELWGKPEPRITVCSEADLIDFFSEDDDMEFEPEQLTFEGSETW